MSRKTGGHRGLSKSTSTCCEALESRRLLHGSGVSEYLPPTQFLSDVSTSLTASSKADPVEIVARYLQKNLAKLGLEAGDLSGYKIADSYRDEDTGATHVYLRQHFNGLEVANANINATVDAQGRIIGLGSSFLKLSKPSTQALGRVALLSASDAVRSAARELGLQAGESAVIHIAPQTARIDAAVKIDAPGFSLDAVPAKLHYVPTAEGLKLSWNLILRTTDSQHWYDVSIDGQTGELTRDTDWVDHATYNVFARPKENPNDGPRTVQTDPQDTTASPFGWHDTNGVTGPEFTDTRGNNVSAQEDTDNNDTGGFRPAGGSALDFNFPLDLSQSPSVYQSASITNLFYWNNVLHDIHYRYGFTPAAGNFQVNNYGLGGAGNDAVQADGQDGGGTNNANFATPPDGFAPRMQMYNFTFTNPGRDGDLDAGIVVHEYGHGVSNRLTGGPANSNALDALQSGGMGEGWSDWWALMFSQVATDTQNDPRSIGAYSLGNSSGFRRFPYSYSMSVNPQTFADYSASTEVHDSGELWCAALWDLNWVLINKFGFDPNVQNGYGANAKGNVLTLKLVMDALKLQPANPRFTDGRDAILLADRNLTGGANQNEIWQVFARRGLGFSANAGSDANSPTLTPAFDVPANASISGKVFRDTDGDGVRDTGETGLANWRVYIDADNDGQYDVSGPASKITHNSTDVPAPINDYTITTSDLTVSGRNGSITDVNVKLNLTHTFDADLTIVLVSPEGKRVTLAAGVGGSGDNFTNTLFNDAATTPIASGAAPFTGSFKPTSPININNGGVPNGLWQLEVTDRAAGDVGSLVSWGIELTTQVLAEKSVLTNSSGDYTLGSLAAGNYKIREVVQAGNTQTSPAGGVHNLTLTTGQVVTGKEFGNSTGNLPGSIAGKVFRDTDGDGVLDSGETGLSNWTVYLDANSNSTFDIGTTVTRSATAIPKSIPDNGLVQSSLSVTGLSGVVFDLDVKLNITHPFVNDLRVFLISPTGTRVELFTDIGGPGDNFTDTIFDDEATTRVNKGTAPFTNRYKPEGNLGAVDGQNMNGTWKLEVSDAGDGDVGTLNGWSLTFGGIGAEPNTRSNAAGDYAFSNLTPGPYRVGEVLQAGFTRTAPAGGIHIFTLGSGQAITGKNFANKPNAIRFSDVAIADGGGPTKIFAGDEKEKVSTALFA